jgi:hypothetical protein
MNLFGLRLRVKFDEKLDEVERSFVDFLNCFEGKFEEVLICL